MDNSQLLKGILQTCVLSVIAEKETYGYQIIQDLSLYGFEQIKDGTLYPILARLEKKKLIKSRIGTSSLGPKRKYFEVTKDGLIYICEFKKEFEEVTTIAKQILYKGEKLNES